MFLQQKSSWLWTEKHVYQSVVKFGAAQAAQVLKL